MTNGLPNTSDGSFVLAQTPVHLGLGAIAVPLTNFSWDESCLEEYVRRFSADGEEGRLVCITAEEKTWTQWERHPAGDELVVLLSGRIDVVQELEAGYRTVELQPGRAVINPRGIWHTSDVHEKASAALRHSRPRHRAQAQVKLRLGSAWDRDSGTPEVSAKGLGLDWGANHERPNPGPLGSRRG